MKNVAKAIALGIVGLHALPAGALDNKEGSVSQTIILNAPLSMVWDAIKAARLGDPVHRHVLSSTGADYIVEESFEKIPVIGCAKCRYSEHESGGRKVHYQLISSDKFVAFEGEWELDPVNAGKQTALKLTSFVDTGLHLPFSSNITRDRTKNSVATRLSAVKSLVEQEKTPG